MDTVTQIVLGGSIAAGFFTPKLGRSSLFFGAFCGWFPDIDVFFYSLSSWEGLQFHRSFTHSLLILPTLSPIMGGFAYFIESWMHKRYLKNLSYKEQKTWEEASFDTKDNRFILWTKLAFWTLITHPLLDVFTTYGTQLLYPLSKNRYATDAIAIIDILYTIPLIIAFVWAIRSTSHASNHDVTNKRNTKNKIIIQKQEQKPPLYQNIAQFALLYGACYLGISQIYSWHCLDRATAQFRQIGFEPQKMRVKPPILFSTIRRVIAIDAQGDVMVANYSFFSKRPPKPVVKPNSFIPEIAHAMESKEGKLFEWFADGFVIPIVEGNSLRLIDGRYGLLSDLWWSPFQVHAVIQPDGTTSPLQLVQVSTEIPLTLELSKGWNLFIGNE